MILKIYNKLKKPLYFIVILGMLLQISQIANIFTPHVAKAANLINEGFDSAPVSPTDWTFTGITGTYTTSGNYGLSAPSLKFDNSDDQIITPTFSSADKLTFWLKGSGVDSNSLLIIEYYNGVSWNSLSTIQPIPTTGTTQNISLSSNATQLRFTYAKSVGNLALDDVVVSVNDLTPDTTPPVSVMNSLSNYYNASSFPATFSGTATDVSGISYTDIRVKKTVDATTYYWSESQNDWTTSETWNRATGTNNWSWNTSNLLTKILDGVQYTINSRATDASTNSNQETNISDESQQLFNYDNTSPDNGSVLIDNDNHYTSSATVNLTLSATNVNYMNFSNDNTNWSGWETYAIAKTGWILSSGDGTKTVYAKFKDNAGNISDVVSDTIILDATNPTSTPIMNDYYDQSNWSWKIAGTASNGISGINKVEISLKRSSDNKYWNGSSWQSNLAYLETAYSEGLWDYCFDLANLDNNVTYLISSQAYDNAGNNQNILGTDQFTYNSKDVVGSVKINSGQQITNSRDVVLNLTVNTEYKMAISNSDFVATDIGQITWVDFSATYSHQLSDGNGTKTVYVKFKDCLGNVSQTYTATIYYHQNSENIAQKNISVGNNQLSQDNLELSFTANTATTLTLAQYSQNPESVTNISTLGKYFDISPENNSAFNFPVYLKIYFTQLDLANAGISDVSQIKGLYYWDSTNSAWKLYSSDSQSATGAVITSEKAGYIGYVWANVYHFTPMAMGADTVAPSKPANFKAEEKNGEIKLTWDKVSDAAGYYVRYREGTAEDALKTYTQMYLSGNDKMETIISNLKNGIMYEFGVAAKDEAGNISVWAIVEATPKATTTTVTAAETTKLAKSLLGISSAQAATEESKKQEEIKTDTSKTADEGEVKAEEEEQGDQTQSTRAAVTIGIIIIAIGAALGGYYGYQWWLSREEKNIPTSKPPKKDYIGKDKPKSKQSRRW